MEEKVVTEEETLSTLDPAQQLFHYARTGNTPACRDLLKANPTLVSTIDEGVNGLYATRNTALHFACQYGHLPVVELLHSQQANIDSRNKLGSTPLHVAASHGHEPIVRFLIKNEANLNAKNAIDNTPLHCAIYAGHITCVDAILERVDDIKQALLQTPNGVGMSPAKYASSDAMKEFLKKKFTSSSGGSSKPNKTGKEVHKEESKENSGDSAEELRPNMEDSVDKKPADEQKVEEEVRL